MIGLEETIARKIDHIADETGIGGILFTRTDFVGGVRTFGEKVMPLLRGR